MINIYNLQDTMQRDLAWRKKEISDWRSAANRADEGDRYLFRSGQVLLCAHWEGFLKHCAKSYLEHVFSQKIKITDCKPNIFAIAFYKEINFAASAKYPGSQGYIDLAKKVLGKINDLLEKPTWLVDTKGNAGTDKLEEILISCGMPMDMGLSPAEWEATKVFINNQLNKDRHAVAHGEQLPIDKSVILDRAERLLRLLDSLLDVFIDSAINKKYIG